MVRSSLARFGFDDVTELGEGGVLTSAQVYGELEALIRRASPDDACVVYYFGHGGRVAFDDLEGPHAGRVFSYLACDRSDDFAGLIDITLRRHLAALARRCNNLVVVLDACHSGKVARTALHRRAKPPWLAAQLARLDTDEAAPPFVCLAGAPPLSEAGTRHETGVGWLTEHLCRELDMIAARGLTVTWHALAHRLRGRIITSAGNEHQWIVANGPCERRLFSRECGQDVRAVGFVVTTEHAWLRVGTLQGSTLGDRWVLLDLDERELVRGRVCELDLNRSRLELDQPLAPHEPREGHARLLRAASPSRVDIDPQLVAACAARLAASAWLEPAAPSDEAEAWLEWCEGELLAHDCTGRWPTTRWPLERCADAIASLEGHACSRRLLAIAGSPSPLRVSGMPTRLHADELLTLHLECSPDTPDTLFVQLVLIDAQGQPWRLAPEQPEGIEVSREQPQTVRLARALTWPADCDAAALPCTLVTLAASRPLQLAHLARAHPRSNEGLSLGLAAREPRMRGVPSAQACAPKVALRGGVQHIAFELVRHRTSNASNE